MKTFAGMGEVGGVLMLAALVVLSAHAFGASSEPAGGARRYSLRATTVRAFEQYAGKTEAENDESLLHGPFLWVDGLGEKEKGAAYTKLRSGEVAMRRLSVPGSNKNAEVPGGMIHDWEGMVFIAGVKVDDVLKVLEDYDHHAAYYAPDVERGKIESRDGDRFRVYLRFRRKKIVTVVLNTEHEVVYSRDLATRAHSRSRAVRIAQVENAGEAEEREKPPGEDDGFLWRMETWWRMEERDGGVYVQNQVVTLTRDIPTGLGWLIEPFITNIPRETLEFTLQSTQKAVLAKKKG